jgi:hypothetical protein
MAPLTDDFPRRLAIPGTMAQREAMLWQWRDTAAAKKRFEKLQLIHQLFPPAMRTAAMRMFEHQRLYTDLVLNPRTGARQVAILGQVLERTPLHLSVLLMLNSDSDIQLAMDKLDWKQRQAPELLPHHFAAALSARDYMEARRLISAIPDDKLPMPGLREYIDAAAMRD